MKVEELFEMPQFINRELPTLISGNFKKFYTTNSITAKYDIIFDKTFIVGLSKDKTFAFIGERGERPDDNAPGAYILGSVDFKKPLNISSIEDIDVPEKVLQIDGVEINKIQQRRGVGYYLYLALIQAGYVVISDNLQYLGGKELWKKVAKKAIKNNYEVYISDDTELRMKDGKPEVYDGLNIDDAEIWSINNSKTYTLLVAKNKDVQT
jgi:hypothetical protein